ncbi:dihydropteroate synthase [Sulfobacillus thermosulfidooxidans]|uniref:dihydropteroate synthase n=1 Tax=Sulfobacillus thermosulfidooxidans TaxID=28034 RepID=UPI00096BCEB7|nr:dihydropteroate synthase [Sulfobacillus thermosulfidooxidans]OLZ09190.1 dihydropteroate synthase [Sulfobacillus thermosulfidooxidans]OLZ17755.1 dihydropteroate synthase [Sulfobacillus thermosulfidooxidans]OLZ22300.1 dihydropteroate synthase [Sulfobacillus thermosulfidooxidans]
MKSVSRVFQCHQRALVLGENTKIMGIVNVTPDSFSDGGQYVELNRILEHVEQLVQDGADIIDIGAESTRPGYEPVAKEIEWQRLEEPILAIRSHWPDVCLSVDTQKAWVADRAVKAGVDIVNDIWGLAGDPDMAQVVSQHQAGLVMMFNRVSPWLPGTIDIGAMVDFFRQQLDFARHQGISEDHILIDPGLGFGYGVDDNWIVLRHLEEFVGYGAGLLLGPSRKRFLGSVTDKPPRERDVATAAVAALAVPYHVDVLRVHNVKTTRDALRVADKWYRDV